MKERKSRIVLADQFLRQNVYISTMKKIHDQNLKNIVIIGGSASGFSSAWLILNGPASYKKNNSMMATSEKMPSADLKRISNCRDCCSCTKRKNCDCICKCFGFFQYKDWGFDYSLLPAQANIKILCRDRVRVFYPNLAAARLDGYQDYNPNLFTRENGYLYSYTGLRGNAKTLYRKIVTGEERRIQLIKTPTVKDQLKHVHDADIVIWACGYQTNKI